MGKVTRKANKYTGKRRKCENSLRAVVTGKTDVQ